MAGAVAATLPDGRLHLQEGPIDLIVGAEGPGAAAALGAARDAFEGVLAGLVAELPLLRAPVGDAPPPVRGPVARRMAAAVWPHRAAFVTPMAAVAGAVAEHLLAAMVARAPGLSRAWVNNGGDIALHLAPGESLRCGLVRSLARAAPEGWATIRAEDPVRGVATSGWPGRSFSLGIADAATVLAATAAAADAAATVVANAVDADHPAVRRVRACDLDPDSDLGERLVTVEVGELPRKVVNAALAMGVACAQGLRRRGLIVAAVLAAQDRVRVVGEGAFTAAPPPPRPSPTNGGGSLRPTAPHTFARPGTCGPAAPPPPLAGEGRGGGGGPEPGRAWLTRSGTAPSPPPPPSAPASSRPTGSARAR